MSEEERLVRDAIANGLLELSAAENRLEMEAENIQRIKEYLDRLEDKLIQIVQGSQQ